MNESTGNPHRVKSGERFRTLNRVNGTIPGPGEVETP